MAVKKTICPITRGHFRQTAASIPVTIDGNSYRAVPKEMSTGSLGWNITAKMIVSIGGKDVEVQVGLNLTIIGSKELPPESPAGVVTAAAR
jgi:hypothetical protein